MNQKTTQQIYPELPEWSKRDDLGGLVPSEVRQALRTYADETCAARGAAASKPQVKEARERRRWLSDSFNRGTQTLYEVTGDIKDINTMLVPRAALAAPAQAAPANEALKNAALPWPWKTDAEVLDDAISAIEGQNRLKAALRSIAARTTPAAAPAQAGEQSHLPLAIISVPERIWLDLGGNSYEEAAHFSNLHDLTWSRDNATGNGIEYVRADRLYA